MGWVEKRKDLSLKLLESKKLVANYDATFKPFRTATESQYIEAKRKVIDYSTQIAEGDYEFNRPANPLDGLNLAQLKEVRDQKTAEYAQGSGDARLGAKIISINTRIEALESSDSE